MALLRERKWYVEHNYLLLCMVDFKRLHVSSLRFYADTYIITTYYLNNTSVTCIFTYVVYVA